jgi:uncharacterized ferritin-like protein (DUF455 family)
VSRGGRAYSRRVTAQVAAQGTNSRGASGETPPPQTLQRWAYDYVRTCDLAYKCAPPPPPTTHEDAAPVRDVREPGRPSTLKVTLARPRALSATAMHEPLQRAKLLHKFWHHELQAAELMCWALLRFPEVDAEFRTGLVRIAQDEIRHMAMYEQHIRKLGCALGDFAVRDWFWERVPTCQTPLQFVALLGMGLEGANLDHTVRFADWFRRARDEEGAWLQEQVGREEVAHVRFAARWFKRWTGGCDFSVWCAALPEPLTPLLMRGKSVQRAPRLKAELSEDFVAELQRWQPERP